MKPSPSDSSIKTPWGQSGWGGWGVGGKLKHKVSEFKHTQRTTTVLFIFYQQGKKQPFNTLIL